MVQKLIHWGVNSPLIVILLACALTVFGVYAFVHVNVVQADLIAVAKAERTLRSWRLTDDEIAAVKREADKLLQKTPESDREVERTWAEIAIRAPEDGEIVEKNINRGDVSVVNLGANPATSAALRAADVNTYLDGLTGDDLTAAHSRLAARMAPAGMSLELARLL